MPNEQWEVHIHRTISKVVYPLPKRLALVIRNAIADLSENPWPSGYRRIEDLVNTYEFFVEEYRIVYQIREEEKRIKVATINLSFANE
jgi:mRNA-degrading endonuclease RelE of RelBE toxin-antitoxin system